MTGKRKALSLNEKRSLIEAYDKLPKTSQRDAAAKLSVPQASLCTLLKQREKILAACEDGEGDRKRQRTGKAPMVEETLIKWMESARSLNKCQMNWSTTRNTLAKQRQGEAQRRDSGEPTLPTWKSCRHMKFLGPLLKEWSATSLSKGSAGRKSQESGELSEEGLQGTNDWMTPLDSETEEDDIKREYSVGEVNGESMSMETSKPSSIAHDTGEEEDNPVDTEGNASPPSSLSSPLPLSPPATAAFRRPGQKRKGLTDYVGNTGGHFGRSFVGDDEADEMFFFSLLPYFRRLSYKKRSALKIQILQVVYEAVFE